MAQRVPSAKCGVRSATAVARDASVWPVCMVPIMQAPTRVGWEHADASAHVGVVGSSVDLPLACPAVMLMCW